MLLISSSPRSQTRAESESAVSSGRFPFRLVWCSLAILVIAAGTIFGQVNRNTVAQQNTNLESQKLQFEVDKLQLEVRKLQKDNTEFPGWVTATIAGVLGGLLGTFATIWIARKTRIGDIDKAVHTKRLESYPKLVWAGAPLAVYFPHAKEATSIGPGECQKIGENMSKWYFSGGGLLLSVEARNAYFRLARALTRAAKAERLSSPTFSEHAELISVEQLRQYRELIRRNNDLDDVENWQFGAKLDDKIPANLFRDYVFLQELTSKLRTELAEDLRGRRRPS
jgi:hypothetical protein